MFNLFENNILFVKRRELPKEGKSENLFCLLRHILMDALSGKSETPKALSSRNFFVSHLLCSVQISQWVSEARFCTDGFVSNMHLIIFITLVSL
jgi:hypothetical protein